MASLKSHQPPVRVLVLMGDQTGLNRVVAASITTEAFVAQEMRKAKPLVWMPKFGGVVSMIGYGRSHCAVGHPPKLLSQPVVPGR